MLLKRKCIDDTNKEFEPKFLIKELCNKEFIMWSINSSKFAKKLNFKDDYSTSKFSKYIYISEEYIDNDLCFKLISRSSKFISKIPNVLLTDEIIEYALNKNIRILGNIPQERRTQERCKYAVSKNGLTLLYVPDYLKTLDICTDAVLENPKAIKYVPIRLLNNSFLKHIISLGVKIDKENYDYINSCLKFHENKCSEELLSENVILTYDSSINVPID